MTSLLALGALKLHIQNRWRRFKEGLQFLLGPGMGDSQEHLGYLFRERKYKNLMTYGLFVGDITLHSGKLCAADLRTRWETQPIYKQQFKPGNYPVYIYWSRVSAHDFRISAIAIYLKNWDVRSWEELLFINRPDGDPTTGLLIENKLAIIGDASAREAWQIFRVEYEQRYPEKDFVSDYLLPILKNEKKQRVKPYDKRFVMLFRIPGFREHQVLIVETGIGPGTFPAYRCMGYKGRTVAIWFDFLVPCPT